MMTIVLYGSMLRVYLPAKMIMINRVYVAVWRVPTVTADIGEVTVVYAC